jgi:hypothetical protein
MCRAVELHDKFLLAANEVGKIRPNGLLANKLEPAEKAVSKSSPKLAFRLSLVVAQPARSTRFG